VRPLTKRDVRRRRDAGGCEEKARSRRVLKEGAIGERDVLIQYRRNARHGVRLKEPSAPKFREKTRKEPQDGR
jgi:hypothetical protein